MGDPDESSSSRMLVSARPETVLHCPSLSPRPPSVFSGFHPRVARSKNGWQFRPWEGLSLVIYPHTVWIPLAVVATGVYESENVSDFAEALARAQSKMCHPTARQTNPRFGNRYPSLADVIDAVRGPLAAEGIAIWTTTVDTDTGITVTMRFRRGEQWAESALTVELPARDPQAIGSALTYCRRYLLSLLCNIAADADDDAETVSTRAPSSSTVRSVTDSKRLTAQQVDGVRQRAAEDGASSEDVAGWVSTATAKRTVELEQVLQSELPALRDAHKAWQSSTAPKTGSTLA